MDKVEMQRAIDHAISNPIVSRGRTSISRVSALITNHNIRYYGWNQYKTHPMMFRFSKNPNQLCLHAEIDALLGAYKARGADLSDFDVYVARVLRNGSPAFAKPCETCMGALTFFKVRRIYWTPNPEKGN